MMKKLMMDCKYLLMAISIWGDMKQEVHKDMANIIGKMELIIEDNSYQE